MLMVLVAIDIIVYLKCVWHIAQVEMVCMGEWEVRSGRGRRYEKQNAIETFLFVICSNRININGANIVLHAYS